MIESVAEEVIKSWFDSELKLTAFKEYLERYVQSVNYYVNRQPITPKLVNIFNTVPCRHSVDLQESTVPFSFLIFRDIRKYGRYNGFIRDESIAIWITQTYEDITNVKIQKRMNVYEVYIGDNGIGGYNHFSKKYTMPIIIEPINNDIWIFKALEGDNYINCGKYDDGYLFERFRQYCQNGAWILMYNIDQENCEFKNGKRLTIIIRRDLKKSITHSGWFSDTIFDKYKALDTVARYICEDLFHNLKPTPTFEWKVRPNEVNPINIEMMGAFDALQILAARCNIVMDIKAPCVLRFGYTVIEVTECPLDCKTDKQRYNYVAQMMIDKSFPPVEPFITIDCSFITY